MSKLEEHFQRVMQALAPDVPLEREFAAIPGRKFRWDFRAGNLLIEVEGGTWVKGGHSTGTGIERDCMKQNLAVLHGYTVLRFTTTMIRKDPAGCAELVQTVYRATIK